MVVSLLLYTVIILFIYYFCIYFEHFDVPLFSEMKLVNL